MMGRIKSEQAQHFYQFQLSPPRSSGAEDRYCSRSFLAPQRTCTSLFVHGSAVDRSGTDDPDAGRGICLCDPLGAADLSRSPVRMIKLTEQRELLAVCGYEMGDRRVTIIQSSTEVI